VSEYPSGSVEDRKMLETIPNSKLLDLLFLQVRNLWRVDGLYFLGIEKKFGPEVAAEIDASVWETLAAIEAKYLQKTLQTPKGPNIAQIMDLLRKSSWALDQPFKTIEIDDKRAILWIMRCRTQETRLNKDLTEFPCKNVRLGYLRNFARTLNPEAKVNCLVCPPDKHPRDSWCKWEFTL
jgi:hypothetical protein